MASWSSKDEPTYQLCFSTHTSWSQDMTPLAFLPVNAVSSCLQHLHAHPSGSVPSAPSLHQSLPDSPVTQCGLHSSEPGRFAHAFPMALTLWYSFPSPQEQMASPFKAGTVFSHCCIPWWASTVILFIGDPQYLLNCEENCVWFFFFLIENKYEGRWSHSWLKSLKKK